MGERGEIVLKKRAMKGLKRERQEAGIGGISHSHEGGRGIWLSGFVPDDKSRTRALAEGYLPPNSLPRPPSAGKLKGNKVEHDCSSDDDIFSVGAVMLRMLSGRS